MIETKDFVCTLPTELHKRLKIAAADRNDTMNEIIITALEKELK